MITTKQKGSIGELAVASDLSKRGYQVAFPYGEYGDWDLLVNRNTGLFERVQVKYGRVAKTNIYNSESFEWIAVYDPTTDQCFYLPSSELTTSSGVTYLRLKESVRPNKTSRPANKYQEI